MATRAQGQIVLERLRTLPLRLLRPSALVDFVLFLACGKPAVRLLIDTGAGVDALKVWCLQWDFDFAADPDGFACVTAERGSAYDILEIDRRPEAHEVELGRALGYPDCCTSRVAAVGESNIDEYAAEVAAWPFTGRYLRINPAGYRSGRALISHLPCSPTCDASLDIAETMREFVLAHASEHALSELCRSPLVSA